jgi:protein TonB
MTKGTIIAEPNMPWLDDREDRFFRRLSIGMLLLFVAAGIVLNTVQLPEVIQKNLVDVSPRLAKLILEKEKVKPPPKPEAPPPEKEKQPEKKNEIEKPKVKKEVKKEVKKDSAREAAKKSGLIALSFVIYYLR